jgi:hypothetical protein
MKVSDSAIDYLNSLCWHDSVLQKIEFIRTNSLDQVVIELNLLADWKVQVSTLTRLIFKNCMSVKANMNWGVKCLSDGEMIDNIEYNMSDPYLQNTFHEYNKHLMKEYAYFKMTMASTGSTLELTFNEFEVIAIDNLQQHNAPPPLF